MADVRFRNSALARMAADEVALGLVVRLARSGEIARIAKTSGHDFLFLDTQHALYSVETIGHIAQAAIGCGIATLVRVPRFDDQDIPRLLDAGVSGIVAADVADAGQARRLVEACKFPPLGRRSVQTTYSVSDYRPVPVADLMRELDANTLVVCMIETAEGVRNMDEIAAVEGVDVVHLGCTDLLADMGRPGAFEDPDLAATIGRLLDVCRRTGRFAGLGGERDLERLGRYIGGGVRFITTQTDIAYLMEGAARRAGELRRIGGS